MGPEPPAGIANAAGVPAEYGACHAGGGAGIGREAAVPEAPSAAAGGVGGAGDAGPVCGSVNPHFEQNSEPSALSSPQ